MEKKIIIAQPRGFCAGVDRAVEIVEKALEIFGNPVYVRHEIVHNEYVVNSLRAKGAVFVDEVADVPDGVPVIFSAHGVAKSVIQSAKDRGLTAIDATCPLVTKVHLEAWRLTQQGFTIILIGHAGHPEVEGTMGQVDGSIFLLETEADIESLEIEDAEKIAFITQTTLSVDDTENMVTALKRKFPNIQGPAKDDICYATQNRQNAVKEIVRHCDLMFVIGSLRSSNSNRLREVAANRGVPAFLIDTAADIDLRLLEGKETIGITAGASAPEILVHEVIAFLQQHGWEDVEFVGGVEEHVAFPLPKELRQMTTQG